MLVFLCKHPVYLWGAWRGPVMLVPYYYFASRRDSHGRTHDERLWGQEGSRELVDAALWGRGTWQGAKGGLRSPSSEAGQGADSWEGLPGG